MLPAPLATYVSDPETTGVAQNVADPNPNPNPISPIPTLTLTLTLALTLAPTLPRARATTTMTTPSHVPPRYMATRTS